MSVLVTGGAGFIGSHLVDGLINDDFKVFVIDSMEKESCPHYMNAKAKYIYGRVNEKTLSKIKDVDYVFHFASRVGVPQSYDEIVDFIDANVISTAELLEWSKNKNIKKIILAGSMSIYGEQTVVPISELVEQKPISIYGLTKQMQENLIHMAGKYNGFDTFSLRFFSVYGSRQTLGNPYAGPIPIFIDNNLKGMQSIIYEDGKQFRDFIHVSDAVEASILTLKERMPGNYNIGTGKGTSIFALFNLISSLMNIKIEPKITFTQRWGDIRNSLADVSEAKQKLGFYPKVSLEEGLKETINWSKESYGF